MLSNKGIAVNVADGKPGAALARMAPVGTTCSMAHKETAFGGPPQGAACRNAPCTKGLGIMRACLETQTLQRIEARMDEIADRAVANATERQRDQREGLSLQ
jgi:hypothetical protein